MTLQSPILALMVTMGTFSLIKFILGQFGKCMQLILASHIPRYLQSLSISHVPPQMSLLSSCLFVLFSDPLGLTRAISMTCPWAYSYQAEHSFSAGGT